ncbi:MAG: zinc ABC transporter solute-binding protein [Rhodospirillales bacterium]|jgi:zinc transport system substrate-binding protein|nr:zinc ABC transporter solute-binding protein [Rhodospirillales bacterium]
MHQLTTSLYLKKWLLAALFVGNFLAFEGSSANASEAPRVVASIVPVHGLVSRVMDGVGEPQLLIAGTISPHAYNLKPSGARKLDAADAVFWIGPQLEAALARPIEALAGSAMVVSLMKDRDRGVDLLSRRKGGLLALDNNHDHDHGDADSADPHIWLNPQNAAAMLLNIAEVLAGIDPGNAHVYLTNAHDAIQEMEILSATILRRLMEHNVAGRSFIFFHDAYQYFEHRFDISPAAIIQVDPEHAPGAKRVASIRNFIEGSKAVCVYSEPQYDPKLISTLIEGTEARHAKLDPVGQEIELGKNLYNEMMLAFVDDFLGCL